MHQFSLPNIRHAYALTSVEEMRVPTTMRRTKKKYEKKKPRPVSEGRLGIAAVAPFSTAAAASATNKFQQPNCAKK